MTVTFNRRFAKQHGRAARYLSQSEGALGAACGLALLLAPLASQGQEAPPALSQVPGGTELQSNTGNSVAVVCRNFATGNPAPLNALQVDLFDRCRELVQTANELPIPGADPEATDNSLGLTAAQLNAALQQMATEEASTVGTLATESSSGQLTNVAARLSALRVGARGASFAGLSFPPGQMSLANVDRGLSEARGGGAGDESGTDWSRVGVFVNGNFGTGDKDFTAREDGFDFDTYGVTGGVDYRFTDALIFGVALGYADLQADFDTAAGVSGGDLDSDTVTFSGYGTYYYESWYLDGILSYGRSDNDLERRILVTPAPGSGAVGSNRTATANTDSDQFSAGLGAGYEFSADALSYGPYGRLTYLDLGIDGYRETGAAGLDLEVDDQDVESLTSALGARLSYAVSQPFGVLLPQVQAEWIHEYQDDARNITARFVNDPRRVPLIARTDDPDRDYFNLGVGASAVLRRGTQVFLFYDTVLGLEDISDHLITAGARIEF